MKGTQHALCITLLWVHAVPTQLLYSVRLVVSFQASRVINNSFLKKGRWIAWYMES